MTRGPSQAVKDAQEYLRAHPEATVKFLAVKFGLDIATIYRSSWWKDRPRAEGVKA